MSLQQNEQWHVRDVIKHLRIDNPLTPMSSFDSVLRYFKSLSQVRRDVICVIGVRIKSKPFVKPALTGTALVSQCKVRNDIRPTISGIVCSYDHKISLLQGEVSANVQR